jgi:hypothetical protein
MRAASTHERDLPARVHACWRTFIGHPLDTSRDVFTKCLISVALPREAHQTNSFNDLGGGLGENRLIEFQDVSETPPKPSGPDNVGKPDLIVDNGNLPAGGRQRHQRTGLALAGLHSRHPPQIGRRHDPERG